MCLELYLRYRCTHTVYSTISHCPHITAANDLITVHGLSESDPKVDRLYEKCDYVAAKRFLAMFTRCGVCEGKMAVALGTAGKIDVWQEAIEGRGKDGANMMRKGSQDGDRAGGTEARERVDEEKDGLDRNGNMMVGELERVVKRRR